MSTAETPTVLLYVTLIIVGEKQQSNQLSNILLLICRRHTLTEVVTSGRRRLGGLEKTGGCPCYSDKFDVCGTVAGPAEVEIRG